MRALDKIMTTWAPVGAKNLYYNQFKQYSFGSNSSSTQNKHKNTDLYKNTDFCQSCNKLHIYISKQKYLFKYKNKQVRLHFNVKLLNRNVF